MTPGDAGDGMTDRATAGAGTTDSAVAGTDVADSTAADAFALLADETRLSILRALVAAEAEDPADPGLAFAALFDRVDAGSTSRFSYHLSELSGRFVRETDGGYVLSPAGWRVSRAVLAGVHVGTVPDLEVVDGRCRECGGRLAATGADLPVEVACDDCGAVVTRYQFPAGAAAGRTPAERARAFDRYARRGLALAADGVCPACFGRMAGELVVGPGAGGEGGGERRDEGRGGDDDPGTTHARHECRRCGNVLTESLALLVGRHPAAVAFRHDHGVERGPHWRDDGVERESVVVARRPPQVQVRLRAGGETQRLTVDADLSVTDDGRRS